VTTDIRSSTETCQIQQC